MKIIDILNKINNGEEVPEKIKFNGDVFIYNSTTKDYEHNIRPGLDDTLLFRVMNTHFITELLKAEVEVIEENKGIERLPVYPSYAYRKEDISENRLKINELVRAVNKLTKEREAN